VPHLSRRGCFAIAALAPAAAGVTAGVLAYRANPPLKADPPLEIPPELARPGASDWPAPNYDLAGTRATDRSALTAANVSQLRVAWRFKFREDTTAAGTFAGTPVVVDGRVYVQTLRSNVYALDLASGKLLWRRHYDRVDGGPNGLGAGWGMLFGATDTSVFALERTTGRELWRRRVTSAAQPMTIAPVAADGLVFASTTGWPPNGKGTLFALDARSGRVRWTFVTIRGEWSIPHEAGGGGAWWPVSLDRSGLLYVGNSNPLPFGGTRRHPNGAAYSGRALYTDSLLVLRATTGRLVWFDQVIKHDVRDYDLAASPILTQGRAYAAGKNGRVYAWDTRARRRRWTASVGLHLNDTGPLPRHTIRVCPGLFGGVLTPMALAAGRLFVPVVDLCHRGSATGFPSFHTLDPATGRGRLTALDAATGRQLWERRLPSPAFGCATVSHDVVFTSTYAGVVYAFRAADGRLLWRNRAAAGINACPAVAGHRLLVGAGAAPSTIQTPTPQLIAYRLR
jgi:outer membrane protein assembly factor BamB